MSPPTTENASTPPFYTRYGFSRPGESASEFAIEPYPEICVDGALRATVIASAIDLVGGFHTREIAGTDATFTADLSLRIPAPGIPTLLIAQGQRLRAGRRLVSTSVTIEAKGSPYAFGTTTFSRISRAPEDAPDIASLSTPLILAQWPLDQPLDQEVGIETIDAPKGIVRLPLRTALLNPEGIMQGALVALVVECAGLALANATLPGQQVVTELDLRYLAANSSGPIESRAAFIGDPTNRMIRIELHDVGKGDRLTTAALLRVADAPL